MRATPLTLALLVALAPACRTSATDRPASPLDASPGARTLGDSLYPELGNGGYDLLHVALELRVRPEDGTLAGRATLEVLTKRALTELSFDLHGLSVSSASMDGEVIEFRQEGSKLVLAPARPMSPGARLGFDVTYAGSPRAIPSPSVPWVAGVGWLRSGQEVYVLSQPNGAASVMPINDHPLDKATYDLRLHVPKPWTAASIGRLISIEEEGDGSWYRFRTEAPTASYLFTFAVGQLTREDEEREAVAWVYYFPPDTSEETRRFYKRGPEILAYLVSRLGPYPFGSCGALLSSLEGEVALETQTLPTYGAGVKEAVVVAHELAHQWLGNSVGVQRWRDIWLSEGLAEYLAWTWLESEQGADAFRQLLGNAYGYMHANELPAPGAPTVSELFGRGMYVRGAWAAHALRKRMGDRDFFTLLRRWAREHRHSSAGLADFFALATEVEGEDVTPTLNAWLFGVRPPLDPDFAWALPGAAGG